MLKRNADKLNAMRGAEYGANVKVSGTDIRMNGGNSAGMLKQDVFNWRKELAQFEAYRGEAYKDADGYSVGLGHYLGSGNAGAGSSRLTEGRRIRMPMVIVWAWVTTWAVAMLGQALQSRLSKPRSGSPRTPTAHSTRV
ncbi:baseplate hub structural protein [Pseudomonas phage vB_PaeP_FBPa18]|nr:baseplate hub structural protein [Pseudomonas phage vB_PaeP_FBPa18]